MEKSVSSRMIWVLAATTVFVIGCSDPKKPETRKTRVEEPRPQSASEKVARQLILELQRGDFRVVFDRFTSTMAAALPEDKLRETIGGVVQNAGPISEVLSVEEVRKGAFDVVTLRTRFGKVTMNIIVSVDGDGKVAGLFFKEDKPRNNYVPPPYGLRQKFDEENVEVGAAPWVLPGSLSLPRTSDGKPGPAIVLVHGSGPSDRDETLAARKPFADIAWGLATHGVAVLRYEKRTKEHPTAFAGADGFTIDDETVNDAVSAVDVARKHPRIDPSRVFVLGHSLGGTMVPRIVDRSGAAGAIILAGSTMRLEDLIVEQSKYILGQKGAAGSDDEQLEIKRLEEMAARVKELTGDGKPEPGERPLGLPVAYWKSLHDYNPVEAASRLEVPMLILQGERDYQVTMKDFARWKAGLAKRKNVTFKTYKDLDHCFGTGEGKSTPADYDRPVVVDVHVIEDLIKFVLPDFDPTKRR